MVGQVLPTSVGGDASRIFETSRRHPGRGGLAAGTVLLERALGGAATLTLAAVGFVLAIGQYNLGAYLWIEGLFVVLTVILAFAMFSRTRAPAARAGRCRTCASSASRSRCARSTRRSTATATTPWLLVGDVRAHDRRPGLPRARDLARRQGRRRRPLAAAVLRDGADALPRDPDPVHDQRPRGARVVLRQLPRRARRERRRRPSPRASSSSSSRCSSRCRARRSWPGRACAESRARASRMADVAAVVVTYNAMPWLERCLESLAGVECVVVDHGSSDGSVEAARAAGATRRRAGEPRPRGRLEPRPARDREPLRPDPQRRRLARRRRARAARRLRGRAPARGGRGAAAPEPGRDAAALGARLPDALAARHRVPLPAQARAALPGAERVLRGRLRPRERDARRSS